MGEDTSIAVILNALADDLDYIEQTLEEIKSTDSQIDKAKTAIEQKASELLGLHLPGNDIGAFKKDAIKQLKSASKVYRPSAGTREELADLDSDVELVLSQARTIFNAVQKAKDEKHIRDLIEADQITDEAAFLRTKISHLRDIIQENSRKFMWCSFENAMSPNPNGQIGRCFPYNVYRRHVELPLSVVRVPCSFSSPPADNGSLPPTITDSRNILTFNYNANKTLLVVLRQCGDQRNIEIYKKTGETYAVCSTLVPRTFQPVYVCLGPDNFLFVADGSLPRIVVFKIEPGGRVWQCVRTLVLPETLGHVSVSSVVAKKKLWIGTSDGKRFVSEKTLASLLPELYIQPNQGLPPGNYKCGVPDCETCPEMEDGARSFVQITTGESFPINDRLTCLSNNVVYLITCPLHKVQYVGITEGPLKLRMKQHRKNKSSAIYKHFIKEQQEADKHQQEADKFRKMALEAEEKKKQKKATEHKEEAEKIKKKAEECQTKADEIRQRKKINVITYVPYASPIKMVESMWIQKLKSLKTDIPSGLNGNLSLSPDAIRDKDDCEVTRDILRRTTSKNYHVKAGFMDDQYKKYCPPK